MEFGYEKLDVSKLARQLVKKIYQLTESFPKREAYGLSDQLRRAVVSIVLNIAEGSAKESKKEFNRFVRLSIGSLVEVDTALKIAIDLLYITQEQYNECEPIVKELYFKLIGLSKYLSQ